MTEKTKVEYQDDEMTGEYDNIMETTQYTRAEDVVLTGAMQYQDELVPIYARPETGDVVYEDPMSEEGMCFGELSIHKPIKMASARIVIDALVKDYGTKYVGRIYTDEHEIFILPDMSHVIFREYGDPIPEHPVLHEIDINIVDNLA